MAVVIRVAIVLFSARFVSYGIERSKDISIHSPSPSYQKFGSAPQAKPSTPPAPPPPAEAKLNPVLVQEIQPIKRPNTFIPGTYAYDSLLVYGISHRFYHKAGRPAEAQDLELIAPTSDDITIRLKKDAALGYASRTEPWQFGLVCHANSPFASMLIFFYPRSTPNRTCSLLLKAILVS